MRKTVFTKTNNKVRILVRAFGAKKVANYVIRARLTGAWPGVLLAFSDECGDAFSSWDFESRHTYTEDSTKSHEVVLDVVKNNIIDYIEPCGGNCEYELVDFSEAPDIISAYIKHCNDVKLNNPALKRFEIYVIEAHEIDMSSCINLRELSIGCGPNVMELDLSNCTKLENLRVCGRSSTALKNIKIHEDCPLQYVDVRGCQLNEDCILAIRRIIERNNGIYEDYIEKLHII